jgi:transcriptional regulator with XRE-family HTH domain
LARSTLQKSHQLDDSVLAGAARLRARCLALLSGALRASDCDQVQLAARLGVRKSAVNAVLRGNGNVRINSLAEYMGALGLEIDMVAVPLGEIEAARNDRRAPRHVSLTMADDDRSHRDLEVVAIHTTRMPALWSIKNSTDAVLDSHGAAHYTSIPMSTSAMKDRYAQKIAIEG